MWYYFVRVALAFSYVGRMAGWSVSKAWLYTAPLPAAVAICLCWGAAVGVPMQALLSWLDPITALRWIFGYALGMYVAVPGFGLFDEATLSEESRVRHDIASLLPVAAYVGVMLAFGFGVLPWPA